MQKVILKPRIISTSLYVKLVKFILFPLRSLLSQILSAIFVSGRKNVPPYLPAQPIQLLDLRRHHKTIIV